MALYRVQSNGKAPTGLQAGDEVVTGGGTYRILGVNADGSYRSALSNQQQTIYNYRGCRGGREGGAERRGEIHRYGGGQPEAEDGVFQGRRPQYGREEDPQQRLDERAGGAELTEGGDGHDKASGGKAQPACGGRRAALVRGRYV